MTPPYDCTLTEFVDRSLADIKAGRLLSFVLSFNDGRWVTVRGIRTTKRRRPRNRRRRPDIGHA